jgi:hypothetical protein
LSHYSQCWLSDMPLYDGYGAINRLLVLP